MSKLPDFIIAGSPRCGTTWLCRLLENHPDVFVAEHEPEPKFFHIDLLYNKGLDFYRNNWFADCPEEKIAGEKTTYYLENSTAAERIRKDLPDVKLIFLLRDPVSRAYSNFLRSTRYGWETENFETALELEEKRESELREDVRYIRPHAYFSRGLYAQLLKKYFELFKPEQILCVPTEWIEVDPNRLALDVYNHLGLTYYPPNAETIGAVNRSAPGYSKISHDTEKNLRDRYSVPNQELRSLLGRDFPIELWQ